MGNQESSDLGYQQAPDGNATSGPSSHSRPIQTSEPVGPSAAERAAALEAKLGKRRPKPKDLAAIKDAHWKRYNDLNGTSQQEASASSTTPSATTSPHSSSTRVQPHPTPSPTPTPTLTPTPASATSTSPSPGLIPGINRSKAPPTAEQLLYGQKRYETPEEAAIRSQRAAVFTQQTRAKAAKAAASKEERWKAYSQFEQATAGSTSENVIVNAPLPFGFPSSSESAPPSASSSADYTGVFPLHPIHPSASSSPFPTPSPSGPPAAAPAAPSSSPSSAAFADPYFQQQMLFLLGKVRQMPGPEVALIKKILQNLLKAGPNPDADGQKFRKLKLSNPKIGALIEVDGALELLMACGFEHQEGPSANSGDEVEMFLVFPNGTPLDIAQVAYDQLMQL